MRIQRTDSNLIAFQKGIHYIKYNKISKIYEPQSKENIPIEVRNKFLESKLIRKMSENHETYVNYNNSSNNGGKKHKVLAKIFWTDGNKNVKSSMIIKGESYSSKKDNAINNMFKSLV